MSNKLKARPKKTFQQSVPRTQHPINVSAMSKEEISKQTGVRVRLIEEWIKARETEMREAFEEEYSRKLYKSQDYLALSHILITYLALRKAFGYTKAFGKYLDVVNECQEEIGRRGVKEIYEEMKRVTGRDIYFDNDELNKEFGFGEDK